MGALSTSDVPLDQLSRLSSDLGPDFELEVDERQIVFKSTNAPSWIMFFANADWWVKALGAYAVIYISEIVKEAGKETWKERAKDRLGDSKNRRSKTIYLSIPRQHSTDALRIWSETPRSVQLRQEKQHWPGKCEGETKKSMNKLEGFIPTIKRV